MKKRLTDAEKWTQNKWFRKLECKYKLFWLFICDSCDSVGVWEEDMELASFLIGEELNKDAILEIVKGKIRVICNGKKWWILDFCFFQYGELKEENINNKPHQSYIALLKKHSLWIDYKKLLKGYKTILHSVKDKDTDKEEDKVQAKDQELVHELQKLVADKYPNIAKLKSQLTIEDAEWLDKNYERDDIVDYLNQMENYGLLHKKTSVCLTLKAWFKKSSVPHKKIYISPAKEVEREETPGVDY